MPDKYWASDLFFTYESGACSETSLRIPKGPLKIGSNFHFGTFMLHLFLIFGETFKELIS